MQSASGCSSHSFYPSGSGTSSGCESRPSDSADPALGTRWPRSWPLPSGHSGSGGACCPERPAQHPKDSTCRSRASSDPVTQRYLGRSQHPGSQTDSSKWHSGLGYCQWSTGPQHLTAPAVNSTSSVRYCSVRADYWAVPDCTADPGCQVGLSVLWVLPAIPLRPLRSFR